MSSRKSLCCGTYQSASVSSRKSLCCGTYQSASDEYPQKMFDREIRKIHLSDTSPRCFYTFSWRNKKNIHLNISVIKSYGCSKGMNGQPNLGLGSSKDNFSHDITYSNALYSLCSQGRQKSACTLWSVPFGCEDQYYKQIKHGGLGWSGSILVMYYILSCCHLYYNGHYI